MPSSPPPASVLTAFNLPSSSSVVPLQGGQGDSFLLTFPSTSNENVDKDEPPRKLVLKYISGASETEYMCSLQTRLVALANTEYRIASPIALSDNGPVNASIPPTPRYVAEGSWTATEFLEGVEDLRLGKRMPEILTASRAMHADLKTLVVEMPDVLKDRNDRWAWADRVAWGEILVTDVSGFNEDVYRQLKVWLDRLFAMWSEVSETAIAELGGGKQFVHGDLSGNILFGPLPDDDQVTTNTNTDTTSIIRGGQQQQPQLAPAIFDFSPYYRPVAYAEAIILADALMWQNEGEEIVRLVGLDWFRMQMLVRTCIFRVVTHCLMVDMAFLKANLPRMDIEGAVVVLERLVPLAGEEVK